MSFSINIDKITVDNDKVIIDIDPNQKRWLDAVLIEKKDIKLSDLKPKDEFEIGDEVFIVLEHTEDGTRVISKSISSQTEHFGLNSDWKTSHLREKLHSEYFEKIANIIGDENILLMDRDLTSLDGLDDYGTCFDRVSFLTVAEYAKYHKILGLEPNYSNWWWLITPASAPSNNYYNFICVVNKDGVIDLNSIEWSFGYRPILNLKSSILIPLNKN